MFSCGPCGLGRGVALLAEGVDRNIDLVAEPRGWKVALLAEGVDRNWEKMYPGYTLHCRPPRGGRG